MDNSQTMNFRESEALARTLTTRFRESLSQLGLSRDIHIQDIDSSFIRMLKENDALSFVTAIKHFYLGLDPLDQMLFRYEYLEKGRHYAYWWVTYFSLPDFRIARKEMTRMIRKGLGGQLYGVEA